MYAGSVQSPGTAEAALTVGAVDKEDALAPFSSVGPRSGCRSMSWPASAPNWAHRSPATPVPCSPSPTARPGAPAPGANFPGPRPCSSRTTPRGCRPW
ncbi:S8 family serine peptidase [Streptomyces xiamenensis]|uniref:S8 family serine peptidase n=1 Tax=Streptomyces xiamenensis TaxID=408015 RepID=UPI0037CCF56B